MATGGKDATILLWQLRPPVRRAAAPLTAAALQQGLADLTGSDARRACTAVHLLATVPGQSLPWLAQQVRSLGTAPDEKRVARLVNEIDSETFAVRDQATTALEQLGVSILPLLRHSLQRQGLPLEVRRRLEQVAERLGQQELVLAARLTQVLELVATPEATDLLRKLAAGNPETQRSQAAQAALRRLARVEGGPQPR